MNEIELSEDLTVIEVEINSYKQIAGQSIWEIGRRLNHVKDNDLAHGEFMKWLDEININDRQANRMMKISKELSNSTTLSNLGETALYMIATLPEEERDKEHVTEKGEIKKPDEMTVRELQTLKKQMKLKDEEIAKKDSQITSLSETVKELDKQPRVIEKEIQVTPIDYETKKIENEQLIEQNKKLDKQLRDLLSERSEVDEKSDKYEQLSRAIQSAEGQLSEKQKLISDYKRLSDLISQSNEFLAKAGGLVYQDLSEVISRDNLARRELDALENRLERFLKNLRGLRNEKKIIEGDVIDE